MTTATRLRPTDVLLAPLRWLERSQGWRRRLLIVAYLIVGAIVGLLTWRATSLRDLPDVGDPFDVAAFVASARVPEAEDAYPLYRAAGERYVRSAVTQDYGGLWRAAKVGWGGARPGFRSWVEANRPALDLWRRGTERPGGGSRASIDSFAQDAVTGQVISLAEAALLEGSRLEAEGDLSGAWSWYRGVLRAGDHLRANGRLGERSMANDLEARARVRIASWAADPKIDAALLRSALDELHRLDERTPPASDTLKAQYLDVMHELDDPSGLALRVESYDELKAWHRAVWFVRREPDRSRRVARLAFANWLAQCDRPRIDRPRLVGNHPTAPIWHFYVDDPAATPAARAVEPEKLFLWLDSTSFLWRFLPALPTGNFMPDPASERRLRAGLIVPLAERLYRLENGRDAPAIEALVPRYLKAIPDSYAPAQ